MPPFDLPSRVIFDEAAFELSRSYSGKIRVAWNDIRSARVERRLTVETQSGVVEVPRNARGYIELFDALVERRLVEVPQRLEWGTVRWAVPMFFVGLLAVAAATPALMRLSDGILFGLGEILSVLVGAMYVGIAICSLEHWVIEEGRMLRRSIFGRRVYDDATLLGTGPIRREIYGYPHLRVHTATSFLGFGFGSVFVPAELLPHVLKRPLVCQRRVENAPTPPSTRRGWNVWLLAHIAMLAPLHSVWMDVPDATLRFLAVAGLLVMSVAFCCGVTTCRLLSEFRADGFWRLTFLGVRFDAASDLKGIRRTRHGLVLARNDDSHILVEMMPVDWILRHWLPNEVAPDHDGYRTASRGTNERSIGYVEEGSEGSDFTYTSCCGNGISISASANAA